MQEALTAPCISLSSRSPTPRIPLPVISHRLSVIGYSPHLVIGHQLSVIGYSPARCASEIGFST